MSYSTVAVPWTYPHQPAQRGLGGGRYDDIDVAIMAFAVSIIGGGWYGYKKYGALGLVGGAVLGPVALNGAWALYGKFQNRNEVCKTGQSKSFVGNCSWDLAVPCPTGQQHADRWGGECWTPPPPSARSGR